MTERLAREEEKQERRGAERVKTWFEALHESPPTEGLATLTDVSAIGARLEGATATPEEGAKIRIYVRLPGRRLPLGLSGTVVRHTDSGFAIEFDAPNAEVVALVGELDSGSPEETQQTGTRIVPVYCFCDGIWISGGLCLPAKRVLVDHLNQNEPFLRLKTVILPGRKHPLEFLALRSSAVSVVIPAVPGSGIERDYEIGRFVEHRVTCLMRGGTVTGVLRVLDKLRVSDHLARSDGFLSIRSARLAIRSSSGELPCPPEAPVALVNSSRVIGVSELGKP